MPENSVYYLLSTKLPLETTGLNLNFKIIILTGGSSLTLYYLSRAWISPI